jgi:hypothetical protein
MKWGPVYRELHEAVWTECRRVLRRGGQLVLNCSNFIADRQLVVVTDWHVEYLITLGLTVVHRETVATPRFGLGQNQELRVETEDLVVLLLPQERITR